MLKGRNTTFITFVIQLIIKFNHNAIPLAIPLTSAQLSALHQHQQIVMFVSLF